MNAQLLERLEKELTDLINRENLESGSDTPDFILAKYLLGCLEVFDRTLNERAKWYGHREFD